MSVQGKCNLNGKPVDPGDLDRVRPVLAPYGPDGEGYICKHNVAVLYRAFHTTKESRSEVQPHIMRSGAVLAWDGRLDNREELSAELSREVSLGFSDVQFVSAAYNHWGTGAFGKLIGDWALSVWNPRQRSLILARDFVGTRQIYYSVENEQVTWCTILDPLVLFAAHSFALDEEYVAGWLSYLPASHLTPYVGISSVSPSSFVRFAEGRREITKYWDFDSAKHFSYRSDSEYEEHFRTVFANSVRRRLRSSSPILAELSGGIDSSSIVCMADRLSRHGNSDWPRLDTVSYYDDSEPNWNERPYFSKVEDQRGRRGCHINVGSETPHFEHETESFVASPAAVGRRNEALSQLISCFQEGQTRVLLSGMGGDEVMGGVPTPTPELADHIASVQWRALAKRLELWALYQRKPWFHLFGEALRVFLPRWLSPSPNHVRPAPWLERSFVQRNRAALRGYVSRTKLFGSLPSFQDNQAALDGLRRQLQSEPLEAQPLYEKRCPYLDRDLLEFVYAIPREQLVRPGQRRSLMRRSLIGIVPDEVLNRRRKAYVARAQLAMMAGIRSDLAQAIPQMFSAALGIILPGALADAVTNASQGNGYRACNTILPSLRFNEHGSQWHPKTEPSPLKKVEVTNALLNSNSAPSLTEAQEGSLAAVARAQPKKAPTEVITEIAHAAPGYSSYGFPYCSKDRCFRASLQVPIKARKDEQFQTAYTGLFEFQVPVGDTTAVIQASTGAPTKLGFLTREQFINTKIDWWIDNVPAVYFSGAGKAEVYSEQLTELSGMPARLATFRSPTAFQSVVTQQAAYMAPGVFVQIRCSVPEKAYADAQDMCEHVVRSLEVPLQEGTP